MSSILHPHILKIIQKYLDYNTLKVVSQVCKQSHEHLERTLYINENAKKILKWWYLKSRPHALGDILYTGNKTYIYLNTPGTEFLRSWQEWDGSDYPIEWERIKPNKNKLIAYNKTIN
jgi:hypothetical protein